MGITRGGNLSSTMSQYAYRAQKSLGVVQDYVPVAGFQGPDVPARTHAYSSDGRLYAYALPTGVSIFQAEGAQLLQTLQIPNVVELSFSPRGTYLATWERPVKLEDGAQHKNLRVFSVSTGSELVAFSQKAQDGWEIQYTVSESYAVRLVGNDVQVFKPTDWSKGIIEKLKVEGATSVSLSPGLNPSIAVFVAEKKGQPASIKVFGLNSLSSPPTCQKTFFKADRAQLKWNTLGTHLLLLTQTEVDNSNKSYYGETGLYLLNALGNFDCRVTLDKEGPIHDFAWSPNSKEFGVVYGYMPAKTMLFDQRVKTLHDFGSSPHNYISFNPQGRLLALAGFGNLAGKIDIIDRRSMNKITTISAPNTSYCTWSPCGRFILTATLSPRLRVDNGVRIWHCTGPLVHVQNTEELYSVLLRPAPVESFPPFPIQLPPAPVPGASVADWQKDAKPTPTKPAGAYRPPGARGLATPAIFKREDEGGIPSSSGHSSLNGRRSVPGAPPSYQNQNGSGGRSRAVPGAPPPGTPPQEPNNRKKKKGKRNGDDVEAPVMEAKPSTPTPIPTPVVEVAPAPVVGATDPDAGLDQTAKKARNLNKKLKAIDELKEKLKRGERLEATQLRKIDGEAEIRRELAALGI